MKYTNSKFTFHTNTLSHNGKSLQNDLGHFVIIRNHITVKVCKMTWVIAKHKKIHHATHPTVSGWLALLYS